MLIFAIQNMLVDIFLIPGLSQNILDVYKRQEFNSNNTLLLNVEQVKQKLLSLEYIREEIEKMEGTK